MLIYCLLWPKFAVSKSYNSCVSQNGSIAQTFTHAGICMLTVYGCTYILGASCITCMLVVGRVYKMKFEKIFSKIVCIFQKSLMNSLVDSRGDM